MATTTYKLNNLSMKDNHHIVRYNINFNKYAILPVFNKWALYAKYYKELIPHIKSGLVFSGHPRTI